MTIFVNEQFSKCIKKICKANVIPLSPFDKLDAPVSAHADMLVFVLNNKIFLYKEYYEANKGLFSHLLDDYEFIMVEKQCGKKYPSDVALNVLRLGNTIFAKADSIADEILAEIQKNKYELVNVNQGYTSCSTLALTENTIITADKGIAETALSVGKDALLIEQGQIFLDGYNYGFIGGASFVIEDTVYFMGDIKKHSDYIKIRDKIESLGMKIKSISLGDVCDFGGVRVIWIV